MVSWQQYAMGSTLVKDGSCSSYHLCLARHIQLRDQTGRARSFAAFPCFQHLLAFRHVRCGWLLTYQHSSGQFDRMPSDWLVLQKPHTRGTWEENAMTAAMPWRPGLEKHRPPCHAMAWFAHKPLSGCLLLISSAVELTCFPQGRGKT